MGVRYGGPGSNSAFFSTLFLCTFMMTAQLEYLNSLFICAKDQGNRLTHLRFIAIFAKCTN